MKKYFLVAEKTHDGSFQVFATDNAGSGRSVLMEIDADSFSDAVKKVRFSARNAGRAAYCGVDVNGRPYHGEA